MNKKGNFVDVLESIPILIFIGFCVLMTFIILSSLNDKIQGMPVSTIPSDAKVGIADLTDAYPKYFDFLTVAFYIIFLGFSVFSARLIPSNPFFMVVAVFVLIALPFLAMIIENVWDGFTQQILISVKVVSIPITDFFLSHLVYFIIFYSFIVAVALLTKDEVQQ